MSNSSNGANPEGTGATPKSKVRITVADLVDCAIGGLNVEVRCAERVWFQGPTSASGVIEFQSAQGRDLYVSVQRWTNQQMKTVARFFTGKEAIDLKLVSPKIKVKSTGAARSAPGAYQRGTYTVKSGDTLSEIAHKAGVSTDYLAQINNIRNVNRIRVGQVLRLPPAAQRTRSVQPAAPAPAQPPHQAPITPERPAPTARGTTPPAPRQANPQGNPVTTVRLGQAAVVFPLKIKPLNEPNGTYPAKNWRLARAQNATCFGRGRGGGRLHAARDLYAPDFTEVVAVAAGTVLRTAPFYLQTNQVSVAHETSDGRKFIVRYGELHPASIVLRAGDSVRQGQVLGTLGILRNRNGTRLNFGLGAARVSMLHFELYTGAAGMATADNLTNPTRGPYFRRSDLIDGLALLEEGFNNTFREGASTLQVPGERRSPASLALSPAGLAFIKDYEKLRLDYYEDSEGYCTVGWGKLTGGKVSCARQGIRIGDRITRETADRLLRESCVRAENHVKNAIRAALYQHEFDALVSLAYNCGDIGTVAPSLCRKINARQYRDAAVEFLDITNGGTRGLVIRRRQENAMFLNANYDSTH